MTDPHGDLELIDLHSAAAAPKGQRRRADPATSTPSVWRRRRTSLLVGALLVLGLVALWGFLAYQQLASVRDDLVTARDDLAQAVDAVGEGDLTAANALLAGSRATFASVPGRVNGALTAPARLIPSLRRTLRAVTDLATAAEVVAGVGEDVTGVIGADGQGLGALTPTDGRIPVDTFTELAPVLSEAEEALVRVTALVEQVPRTGIDPAVADARTTFLELVDPVSSQAATVSRVVSVLPDLFGADGARRYMVVAANPTEARGSGGFFGAYTIMEAVDGELTFSPVVPTQDLPQLPRGQIPWPDPSLEARYDAYGGTGFIVNLNMTPDFPSAATAIERFHEAATGDALDGVVAVDPFAFEGLLRIAGPVELPGYGTISADDVVEFVSHGAYATILDPEERKGLIGLVATVALQGFLDSPDGVSAGAVLREFAAMVEQEHVLVHVTDPEEQAVLEELGVTGRLGPPEDASGDFLGVFLNSGAPYKVDYWLERLVRYEATLGPGGQASAIVSTAFVNDAPTEGEPAYMIGAGGGNPLEVGDVLTYVSVYCASNCLFYEVPDSGFDGLETDEGRELGFGVTSTWMRLPAGQAHELLWSWSNPSAWTTSGLDRVYRLHYGHQVAPTPTSLDIRVNVPEGFEATGLPDGATVEDGQVRLAIAADRDLDLQFVFSPAAPGGADG